MVLGNKEAPEGQQSFNVYSLTVAENLPQHLSAAAKPPKAGHTPNADLKRASLYINNIFKPQRSLFNSKYFK